MCSDECQVVELVTLAASRQQNWRNNVYRQTFTSLFYLFYPVIPRHKTRKTKKKTYKIESHPINEDKYQIKIKLLFNYC